MRSIKRGLRLAFTAAIVVTLALSAGAAGADGGGKVVYNSIPKNLPGNVPSVGFEATQAHEFGDSVLLAAGGRRARSVDVVLSSWGCESGHWTSGDCATSKAAKFSHPITLNLYEVMASGEPGALLLTDTQTFRIPYRPSADARCTGLDAGKWYSKADATCYNGFANRITFKIGGNVRLPDAVIWAVAFNTTHYGSDPIGATACSAYAAGCGYDSLNVGVESFAGQPSRGTDADENGVVWDSETPSNYCVPTVGAHRLRVDTPCWTDFRPLATIRTSGGHHSNDNDEDDD